MVNITFGIGHKVTVQSERGVNAIESLPVYQPKVKSIMKLQEQIVAQEHDEKFIKVTEDNNPLWKFNYKSRLNII